MSQKARDEAVYTFGEDPEVRIMIASLKCGGVGLVGSLHGIDAVECWLNACRT